MVDATYDGDRIIIGGTEVELEKRISKVLPLDDRVIVLFDHDEYDDADFAQKRNIVALDGRGKMLWRIEESKPIDMDGEFSPDPFIGMGFEDNGQRVVVCDMDGLTLDLDPQTGRLSNPVFTR